MQIKDKPRWATETCKSKIKGTNPRRRVTRKKHLATCIAMGLNATITGGTR